MAFCAALRTPDTADLFAEVPEASTVETPAPAIADAETVVPPVASLTVGEQYSQIWTSYCRALDAYMGELGSLVALEQSFAPSESYSAAVSIPPLYKRKDIKKKFAEGIRSRLIRIASDRFAPDGVNLAIDTGAVNDKFPIEFENKGRYHRELDERCRIEFDPAACWRFLEDTYGGNAGAELAWKQAANALVDAFGLHRQDEVKIVSGRVVIEKRVWTEKSHRGLNELSCSSATSIRQALMCLHSFAEWAGFDDLGQGAYRASSIWGGGRYDVTSREVVRLGDGCDFVTFLGSFNFRFSSQVAERMQVFVSTYAPQVA